MPPTTTASSALQKKAKKADDENDTPRPVDETVAEAPEAPDNLFDEEFDLEEDL